MVRILVVDDDEHILKLITLYMENAGYEVLQARNGSQALALMESSSIDLAIIDIMLPEINGIDLCHEIRKFYEIPVVMVSAKSEACDKVKAFQSGTDDYVVKPFEPIELVMRIKALLRRYQIYASSQLIIGKLTMDTSTKEIRVNNESITMPLKEFDLLFKLASTPNQIYTRRQLIESIWGMDYNGDERTVDVHIKRIREKIKVMTHIKIRTVRGLGYRLEVMST
ncbi:response regulator transcription factor [Hazenella sp. IB182357]|uniref:Heme response regulator HssR n=1 Tax=Polycladospora coralii TaxID=2771432 RepID=A0A926N9P0_9BACL|nr:response regulator transcription factor [Polycladospora coralii]MBD1371500.1 response regulator transcription factor [Polycladospora coralii]MBS7528966.1 response regulator transcription factor [Polycladospora coralii]